MKAMVVYDSAYGNTEKVMADTEGPLLEGELERAADWAKRIVATF